MIDKETKYFYFFRGSLNTHLHLYKGWVDIARKNGLPMELVTILNFPTYLRQRDLIRQYKTISYLHIICCIPKTDALVTFIYFFFLLLLNKKVVVHLRKRSAAPFNFLKKIFDNRLRYIIELEGDYQSERDYLIEHPFKEGFYNDYIKDMTKEISRLKQRLENADHILAVAPKLKEVLVERYPESNLQQKIDVIPTGVDCEKCYFSQEKRGKKRKSLGIENQVFVMIYIGNAYYSWQNVFRTIEIFKLVKEKVAKKAFLILLVRQQDHAIVKEFLDTLNVPSNNYILTQVRHDGIPEYLNASDMGVLLRHKHIMNEVASPGKFGDYTACGLPVLMTEGIATFSEQLTKTDYGIVLKDMDDDEEIIQRIAPFIEYDKGKKAEISQWAHNNFSTAAHAHTYVNMLSKV